MNDFPDTSASLITRIQDPGNAAAWKEFEQTYRPVIFRIARAKGMQYADAFDLVQQVLMSVAMAIPNYESSESGPPFRNWLSRITRNAALKALTRRTYDRADGGTKVNEFLSAVPSSNDETEAMLIQEYRREIFLRAAERVRREVNPKTWLAFEWTVIQNQPVDRVGEKLALSVGNIYAARSRVMKRLKEAVSRLDETGQENELKDLR